MKRTVPILLILTASIVTPLAPGRAAEPLAIAMFQVDATPPLGSPLCHGACLPARTIVDRLTCRGVVLLNAGPPIVLCAVDWVGIANDAYDAWRNALAGAAGTTPDRVALHCVHQHDAPGCDFAAEELLAKHGLGGKMSDPVFVRATMNRAQAAIREALAKPVAVTHVGLGKAKAEQVASNRRILGPDGKFKAQRFTSCPDPEIRAAPEGVIDPYVRLISFWAGDRPVVSMTYYATHPQSFYCRGAVSVDFVGLARGLREATLPEVFHVHFNGAGGNIGAGKYNDGRPPRRFELANRLAQGMADAWDAVEKRPITADQVGWGIRPVALPPRESPAEDELLRTLGDSAAPLRARVGAARDLVWLRRCRAGGRIDLSCLRIGPAYVLHMPGELFVEYALAAQAMRPDAFVCMAAYGDYGPGYICTTVAYEEGGYEAGPASRVAPGVEPILMSVMQELLGVRKAQAHAEPK